MLTSEKQAELLKFPADFLAWLAGLIDGNSYISVIKILKDNVAVTLNI